ncbi:MAG: diphthamide synthesis protein, partial [Methanosarcinales archaeon]|nr:diphthamide synthesis protein [Methanosarcinales archaeon]
VDVMPVLKIALPMLTKERIGVLTTVQHVHKVDEVCKYLISEGKVPVTCEVSDISTASTVSTTAVTSETYEDNLRIRYPGQLLGCDFSAARIPCDEYLYIGGGEFHPMGVAIATGRRVLVADPMVNKAWFVDTDRIMRQRFAAITRARDAACFGIIVSTKRGQLRLEVAEEMVKLARDSGRDAYIISMDLITPEQLLAFKADAFVSTACPRVAVDDNLRYNRPMLTPIEFEILVGKRQWDEFVFDEITQ